MALTLKAQEIPLDHKKSRYIFLPSPEKPFVATPAALEMFGDLIGVCLQRLQAMAQLHRGLDYLQVFESPEHSEPLWFIEDDEGGAITALLPSDY